MTLTPELAEVSCFFAESRYAAAIDALSRTAGVSDDPHLLLCRGLLLWANDDTVAALESLEQAELMLTLPPIAYCVLAECYLQQSQAGHARTVLVGLGIDDSLGDELLGPLARGLSRVGEHGRSNAACHLAAARYPEADEPWWWIAENCAAMGGAEQRRLAALQEAWERSPRDTRYARELACIHDSQGNFPAAWRYAQAALREGPLCPASLIRLERIFEASGDAAHVAECRVKRLVIEIDSAGTPVAEETSDCERALFAVEETASLQPVLDDSLQRVRSATHFTRQFKHQ